jgi:flagellar motor switch protein FliN
MSLTAEASIDATPAVEELAREVVRALAGADGAGLVPGPAAEQGDLSETIPEGGGVAAAAEVPGIGVVAVMLSAEHAAHLDAAHGVWTTPVTEAIRTWARAHASTVDALTPPCPASAIGELLPRGEDLRVTAAGLFDGERHAGTVALTVASNLAAPARTTTTPADLAGPAASAAPTAAPIGAGDPGPLQALAGVEMAVTAELGRTTMAVAELLGLAPGSLIELDRAAGSPIDVLVNGTIIARGEVVVIDDDFGLRITEIIGTDEAAS